MLATATKPARASIGGYHTASYSPSAHDLATVVVPDWHQATSAANVPFLGYLWNELQKASMQVSAPRHSTDRAPLLAELSHILSLPSIHAP